MSMTERPAPLVRPSGCAGPVRTGARRNYLVFGDSLGAYPSLIAVITFMCGVQLLSIGLVGEYVGKPFVETMPRPRYVILDVAGIPVDSSSTDSLAKLQFHAESN